MVGHEHIGVQCAVIALACIGEAVQVEGVVVIREEDARPVVAPLDEVLRLSLEEIAWQSPLTPAPG